MEGLQNLPADNDRARSKAGGLQESEQDSENHFFLGHPVYSSI